MSVNHARRHRGIRTLTLVSDEPRPGRAVDALLAARQALANHLAIADAHDLHTEPRLMAEKRAIEDTIARLDPQLYRAEWTAWIDHDIQQLHGPAQFHPDCYLCTARAAAA